jgi:Protein of unknown function (DUF1003)
MADTNAPLPPLPAHIEETIQLISRLRAEHHQNATPVQRAFDRITTLVGRPGFLGVLAIIVASWISLNLLAGALGYRPIDPPPFSGLEVAVSLASLFMVILILATSGAKTSLPNSTDAGLVKGEGFAVDASAIRLFTALRARV